MSNYKQQQAVILKGIAHQILSMNMPSVEELNKFLQEFHLTRNVAVLAKYPTPLEGYIESPLRDELRDFPYYMKRFSNPTEAVDFVEEEITRKNISRVSLQIIVDSKKQTYLESRYGGVISHIYRSGEHEFLIWENANWM